MSYRGYDVEIPDFDDNSFYRKEKTSRKTGTTGSFQRDSTIHDKLTDLYLDWKEEKKSVEKEHFIKCNYLEELVKDEELELKYISLALYPNKQFLFSINEQFNEPLENCSVLKEEHMEVFRDAIDKEEIPAFFLDEKFQIHRMLYDRHLILHLTKFATLDNKRPPLLSLFILLKPTNSICRELIHFEIKEECEKRGAENVGGTLIASGHVAGQVQTDSPDQIEAVEEEKYKNAIFKLAKPLYFDLKSDKTLRLVLLLEFYRSPFLSYTLKHLFNKKENRKPYEFVESETHASFENIDFTGNPVSGESSIEKHKELLRTEKKIFQQPIANLEDSLYSFLRQREVYEDPELEPSALTPEEIKFQEQCKKYLPNWVPPKKKPPVVLAETFHFITKKGDPGYMHTDVMNIYWDYDAFYRELTTLDYVYKSILETMMGERVGNRSELDKYIMKYAKLASGKFTQYLTIRHKTMNEEFKTIFTCGCLEDMENNSGQSNSSQKSTCEEQRDKTDITENKVKGASSSKNIPRK